MEFNQKLQSLRKQSGLTQEALAEKLYVSRTAVSKWESGRGYPEIETVRAIAKFFSVTVDSLLSSEEILNIAEENGRQKEDRIRDLTFGLLDTCFLLLLFLPLFAERGTGAVLSVSLIKLTGARAYLKVIYYVFVAISSVTGIVTLAMQGCQNTAWLKIKVKASFSISIVAALTFIISLQPYVAVFTLSLLAIKVITVLKR